MHLKAKWLAAAMAAALVCVSPNSEAVTYVMMSDEALLQQSEGAARLTVLEALPSRDGDRETLYRVRIERQLAGQLQQSEQLLALPGTHTAPKLNLFVNGVPRLIEKNTYLVFYSTRDDGVLQPQQLTLGVFGLLPGSQDVYVRFLDGSGERAKSSETTPYHLPRSVERFERWIRDAAAGGTRTPDYLVETAVERPKYAFSVFGFSTPGPARWFQFDSGQSLQWTAAPDGQTGATFDEFAALQTALAAWVDDPGSRIFMSYSGTANSAAACQFSNDPGCFAGHVTWNDPSNQISGSFDCNNGGVLAIGGSSAFSNGQLFNGSTWYGRAAAFVVVQDNAACSLNSGGGANGEELLTHEVGHTIAFGHSCNESGVPNCAADATADDAIMRPFLHGGGRGATLGVDDQAGAAVVYPDPDATQPSADLAITITATPTTAAPGATVDFTITVVNNGPDSASSVSVSNTVFSNLEFVSNSGDCSTAFPCNLATLTNGEQASFTARYTVNAGATDGQLISNTVTVASGGVDDPDSSDNSASDQLTVDVPAGSSCTGECVFLDGFEG